jgi:F0F1-type ATP synthase membrane subunit c/vacuolar-type H+-ATPase subunit K
MQRLQSRLNIIFIAFFFSALVYLIVGFAVSRSGWTPILSQGNLDQILFAICLALSVAIIVIALQIKSHLVVKQDTQSPENVFPKTIFLFAMVEVPSILGLVLFFLAGKFSYLVTLCIVSLAGFLLVKPRTNL